MSRTTRRLKGESLTDADVGAGLRISLPSGAGVLRADVAHGLRDGANAGWINYMLKDSQKSEFDASLTASS